MYFRKLALLLALATVATADARMQKAKSLTGDADARALKHRAKSLKGDDDLVMDDDDGPSTCSGANAILSVSETIGEFSYTGLVVQADNDADVEADAIVGHLSMTATSGAVASIELLESSVVVSSGDTNLVLDPTVPDIKINGESVSFFAFNGILESAQKGFVEGSLKDVAEGYLGMITWINAHSTDIPDEVSTDDDGVGILSCGFWTKLRRLAVIVTSCVGAGAAWVTCYAKPSSVLPCLIAIGATDTCVTAVEHYVACGSPPPPSPQNRNLLL